MHAPQRPADGTDGPPERLTLRAIAVALIVVALWGLATVVADRYRTRKTLRAEQAAFLGRHELTSGHPDLAVRHFRDAVALEPETIEYRLDLTGALLALNQADEATNYLRDVLRRDPVNGAANLSLARIHDRLGNVDEAETAFYRAIYGRWSTGEEVARRQARLELIDFLTRTAEAGRIRAELVQLAAAFPGDLPLQLRAGRSLLDMGAFRQAADVLGAAAERFADPGAAFGLLAEARLLLHDYNGALEAARQAIRVDPKDDDSVRRREVASTAIAMDPTQPRLPARVRVSRIQTLLTRLLPTFSTCPPTESDGQGALQLRQDIEAWIDSPRAAQLEQADAGLDLLEAAARNLTTACPQDAAGDDRALRLILSQLSRVPAA